MIKSTFLILLFITLNGCSIFNKKELHLNGPTVEQAENINKTTGKFVDGIYAESGNETSLSHTLEYSPENIYFINYTPVIVARDFKHLSREVSPIGDPVITVELHESAHDKWYEATKKAFQNKSPLFVIVNGKVVSAPMVNSGPISGGRLQISGDFTMDQVSDIIAGIKERNSKI
ncbi:SecDF P1 head subdomain-containing protein [Nonlabens sp. Asnod3-A02]|uniref:SecDF P1 head subdomain-containing protein n=1 Tax=Nonlabens sp. Asnod3-A02 TaxID=3160579 RepID=UPI00386F50CD